MSELTIGSSSYICNTPSLTILTLALFAFFLMTDYCKANDLVSPEIYSDIEQMRTHPLNVVDNEIGLITPGLYKVLSRVRKGETFEPLPHFIAAMEKRPKLPSTHFWVATRHLLISMMSDDDDLSHDKEITHHYKQCIAYAKRAQKLPRLSNAGLFYEMLCSGGMAILEGARENWVDAGVLGRRSVKLLFKLHDLLPEHQPTLMISGLYNIHTSRLGTLGKVVLSMVLLPVGDHDIGLMQLKKAADDKGSMDVLAKLAYASVLSDFEERHEEAVKYAEESAILLPRHPGVHLALALQYLSAGRLQDALSSAIYTESLHPADGLNSKNKELRIRAHHIEIVKAFCRVVRERDERSLDTLHRFAKEKAELPQEISHWSLFTLANIYRLAGLSEISNELYTRINESEASNWIRDRAEVYRDDKDINDEIHLGEATRKALRDWLSKKPLPEEKS